MSLPLFESRTLRATLHDVGGLLLIPGSVALTAVVVALVAGETHTLPGFGIAIGASVVVGGGLRVLARPAPGEPPPDALGTVAVALGWIGAAAIAALPFGFYGLGSPPTANTAAYGTFWNAMFEGMSALTSTGLSVADDASELPRAMQWWRTALEWVGGMGVALLALTLTKAGLDRGALVTAEINVGRLVKESDNPVRRLWVIYVALTAFSIGVMWVAGMPFWEALNHGATGIATGGFSVTSDSFQSYGAAIKAVTIVVMVLGALDFAVYARASLGGRPLAIVRDPATRWLAACLVVGGLALWGITAARGDAGSALDDAFIWASALGTCGFASVDLSEWSGAAWMWLIAAMFVGAAAGSTGGGLKTRRAALLLANVWWRVRERHGDEIETYRFGGEDLEPLAAFDRLAKAAALATVFVVTLVLGALALMLFEGDAHTPMALFFEAASGLGAVGLSSGVTSAELGDPAKAVLVTLMWLGRLEVMAALMIVAEAFLPHGEHEGIHRDEEAR